MNLKMTPTIFEDARVFIPKVFDDYRGTFSETYSQKRYAEFGLHDVFVQDNISVSAPNVIRGLHGDDRVSKLVSCLRGRIWDIVADMRPSSPTYRKWQGFYLTAENRKQLFVPRGFVHGFLALTEAVVSYKQSAHYDPDSEFCVRWNDPFLAITWPGNIRYPILSEKDANAPLVVPEKEEAA